MLDSISALPPAVVAAIVSALVAVFVLSVQVLWSARQERLKDHRAQRMERVRMILPRSVSAREALSEMAYRVRNDARNISEKTTLVKDSPDSFRKACSEFENCLYQNKPYLDSGPLFDIAHSMKQLLIAFDILLADWEHAIASEVTLEHRDFSVEVQRVFFEIECEYQKICAQIQEDFDRLENSIT